MPSGFPAQAMPVKGGKVGSVMATVTSNEATPEVPAVTPEVPAVLPASATGNVPRITFADLRREYTINAGESKAEYRRRIHSIMALMARGRNLLAPSVLSADIDRGLFLAARIERKGGGVDYRLRPVPSEKNPVDSIVRGLARLTPEQRQRAIARASSI